MQPEVGGNQASDVSGNLAIGDLGPAKKICAFIPSMITAAAAGGTSYGAPTPGELLLAEADVVFLNGTCYDIETLEETRLVRSWGGQAHALSFVDGYSTTALVRRIRA